MLNEIKNAKVEHELQNLPVWLKEEIDEENLLDCLNSSDVTDEYGRPIEIVEISVNHADSHDESIENGYDEFGINTIDW